MDERENTDGAVIYPHMAWMERTLSLVGCYPDVSARGLKGKIKQTSFSIFSPVFLAQN